MKIEKSDFSSCMQIKKIEELLNEILKSNSSIDLKQVNINIEEFNKYKKRLQEKGVYSNTKQGQYYKLRAFKKIFNLDSKEFSKTDIMLLNKDKLNHDYSIRHNLILKALEEEGTRENPVVISRNGITVTKYGIACSKSEIALWDYLLGQFVENGENSTKVILKEELASGLGMKNIRGERFEHLKKALMVLATQSIKIDDTGSKDKATKQINKAISENGIKNIRTIGANLIQFSFIEVEGQLAIKFDIPLMKMYCSHRQYARLLNGQVIKHLQKNPRIYWIAKELAALTRNRNNNVLSIEKLLKNIDEWERYKDYSDKKKYLLRLRKDIETATTYILSNKKFVITDCTQSKIKQGRISIEENSTDN